MPINPAYQFMNSAADLSDKNQFMDFLRRDDRANNNYSDYSADLGNAQDWANTMAAQQPQPAAQPAPQPQQALRPAVVRQPMQAPQSQMTKQDLPPEMPQPEQQNLGYGNIEDIPTNEGLDNTPQSDKHTDLQNQELQRFEQTKLAKQGSEMGIDPRQLYVALAQFSAGMGNIKGKDTKSTAADFYGMQKTYEAQDEARKMRQEEFAARMAPKPVDPLDIAQKQATIEYLKRKGMPQPAAPVDPYKQKLMEAQTRNYDARTKNELLGAQRPTAPTKGTAAPITKAPTADQSARAEQVKQMQTENSRLESILKNFDPTSRRYMGRMSMPLGFKGEDWQDYETAAKQFLEPVLRKRTGAAVTEDELENQMQQTFPMPGDSPALVQAKAVKRRQIIAEMNAWAGGAAVDLQPQPQPQQPVTQGPRGYQTWAP